MSRGRRWPVSTCLGASSVTHRSQATARHLEGAYDVKGVPGANGGTANLQESNMRRLPISLAISLVVLTLTATSVLAAPTIHNLDVTFSGTTVTATADVSGLGSQKPATAQLIVNGTAEYTCTNGGGQFVPGQNPQPATATSPIQDLGNTTNNGRGVVDVSATLTAPQTINARVAGCPNGKTWTATLNELVVTSATLILRQQGQIFFQETFDNPNN
jgi:hypothetical protein